MLNLFISGDYKAWENDHGFMERDRCLTEYILPEFTQRFSGLGTVEIQELKQYPCILAYEQSNRQDAYIVNITGISVRQQNVRIDFKKTGERIVFSELSNLSSRLDIGKWELNRTHWTLKNVTIDEIRPYFSSNARKPTVFISYSWSPPENQRSVFQLVEQLEKDGVQVIYDKTHLVGGNDIGYFIEHNIGGKATDHVLIICNKDYKTKADSRSGGVGREVSVIVSKMASLPQQKRYIPIVFETDEMGKSFLPDFLGDCYYYDLTKETGYVELLSLLNEVTP